MLTNLLTGAPAERLQILRRIAERGQAQALKRVDTEAVDCWQHLLNELSILAKETGVETIANSSGSY